MPLAVKGSMKRSFKRTKGQMSPLDGGVVIQRGIGFKKYQVSVVKQLHQFGNSAYYLAKEDTPVVTPKKQKGKYVRDFFIKTVEAETREQSKRAQAEAKALKRLSNHPNILRLLDSGVSSFSGAENDSIPREIFCGGEKIYRPKLYCFLFDYHSSQTLKEFVESRQQGRVKTRRRRTIFGSSRVPQGESSPEFVDISVILEIFRQMVDVVMFLHQSEVRSSKSESQEHASSDDSHDPPGIIHMNLTPDAFLIEKAEDDADCQYRIKLCGLGCSINERIALVSEEESEKARKLVETATSPRYRAPEMINLHMSSELNERVDVWALGCCFYELLFLRQCFEDHNQVFGIDQKTERTMKAPFYDIPHQHPYGKSILELLGRLLTFKPSSRVGLEEVIDCIDALEEGKSLPPRKKSLNSTFDTESETSSDAASSSAINIGDVIETIGEPIDNGSNDIDEEHLPIIEESTNNVDDEGTAKNDDDEDTVTDDSASISGRLSDDEMAARVMGLICDEGISDAESSFSSGIYEDKELELADMGEMMRRAHADTGGAEATILLLGGKPIHEYAYSSSDESSGDHWETTDIDAGDDDERHFADNKFHEAMLCSQHAILNSIAGDSDSSVKVYAASEDTTSGSESDSAFVVPRGHGKFPLVAGTSDSTNIRASSPLDLNQNSSHSSSSWLEFDPEYRDDHNNLTQRTGPLVVSTPKESRRSPDKMKDDSGKQILASQETTACGSFADSSPALSSMQGSASNDVAEAAELVQPREYSGPFVTDGVGCSGEEAPQPDVRCFIDGPVSPSGMHGSAGDDFADEAVLGPSEDYPGPFVTDGLVGMAFTSFGGSSEETSQPDASTYRDSCPPPPDNHCIGGIDGASAPELKHSMSKNATVVPKDFSVPFVACDLAGTSFDIHGENNDEALAPNDRPCSDGPPPQRSDKHSILAEGDDVAYVPDDHRMSSKDQPGPVLTEAFVGAAFSSPYGISEEAPAQRTTSIAVEPITDTKAPPEVGPAPGTNDFLRLLTEIAGEPTIDETSIDSNRKENWSDDGGVAKRSPSLSGAPIPLPQGQDAGEQICSSVAPETLEESGRVTSPTEWSYYSVANTTRSPSPGMELNDSTSRETAHSSPNERRLSTVARKQAPSATPEPSDFDEGVAGTSHKEWANSLFGSDSEGPWELIDGMCTTLFDSDSIDLTRDGSTRRLQLAASPDVEKQQQNSVHSTASPSQSITPRTSNCSVKPIELQTPQAVFIPRLTPSAAHPALQEQAPPPTLRGRDRTPGHEKKKKKKKKKSWTEGSLKRDMRKFDPDARQPSSHPWAPRAFSPSTSSASRRRVKVQEATGASSRRAQMGPSPPRSQPRTSRGEDHSPTPPPPSGMWDSLRF